MAQIKDLKLTVEKGSMASKAKIKANFTVVFTPAEKRLNLQFGLFVMLYEVDFRPDILIPLPNGFNAMRFANLDASLNGTKNTQDDAIGWTKSGIIMPNGKNELEIELSEEVKLINKNVSNESFRAGVYVSPEISAGFAWSNEVAIPCDPVKPTPIQTDSKAQYANQTTANNAIQSPINTTAPKGTKKKTVVKEIAKPKTPAKSTVKKAVVKKTVVKKVIAEKNTVASIKQESMPNKVTKKPMEKTVVKKVTTINQTANPVKQAPLVNKEVKSPTIKTAESAKVVDKKLPPQDTLLDGKPGMKKPVASKKSPPKK